MFTFYYNAVHSVNFEMNLTLWKLGWWGLSGGEDLMILAWFILSQYSE